MRPRHVYRLLVKYPEVPTIPDDELYAPVSFHWPQKRDYLSLSGAQHRAEVFRKYGAEVEIVRSQPVEWELQPVQFEGQCWLFPDPLAIDDRPVVIVLSSEGGLGPF